MQISETPMPRNPLIGVAESKPHLANRKARRRAAKEQRAKAKAGKKSVAPIKSIKVLGSLGISGLKPVDPAALTEYQTAMRDEGIPQIIEEVRDRGRLAQEARHRAL